MLRMWAGVTATAIHPKAQTAPIQLTKSALLPQIKSMGNGRKHSAQPSHAGYARLNGSRPKVRRRFGLILANQRMACTDQWIAAQTFGV